MSLFDSIVGGASVEVETSLFPPLKLNASDAAAGGPPGFLTQLLRPSVTIRQGNSVLAKIEPAGPPDARLRVLVLVGLGLLAFLVFRWATRK